MTRAETRAELLRFAAALTANPDVAAIIAEALGGAPTASGPRTYSQLDGQRPAWLPTRNQFLRAWATLHAEGHPGATAHGKTRLLDETAADSWRTRTAGAPRTKPVTKPVLSIETPEEQVDRELNARFGVRDRKAAGR